VSSGDNNTEQTIRELRAHTKALEAKVALLMAEHKAAKAWRTEDDDPRTAGYYHARDKWFLAIAAVEAAK
jgi:hypothetical protein